MLKQLLMTARLNNTGSINRNLQLPEKNQSPPKTLTGELESQVSVLRTLTTACLCSAFKELIFNSLSFSKMIVLIIRMICHCMICIACFCYASRKTVISNDALFTLLSTTVSVTGHILTNQKLCCWADRGFKKSKKSLQMVFLIFSSSLLGYTAIPLFCVCDD